MQIIYQCRAFQSTLPAWGETQNIVNRWRGTVISIHSPRMGRDRAPAGYRWPGLIISIHSPRMGRDHRRPDDLCSLVISIHSPRMGRDSAGTPAVAICTYFNPLSPHGERPVVFGILDTAYSFQSTLPAWGETRRLRLPERGRPNFNPLSPHGERRGLYGPILAQRKISIHSPRMGRDPSACFRPPNAQISIHSPRMGRDPRSVRPALGRAYFNPLSPHGERRKARGCLERR